MSSFNDCNIVVVGGAGFVGSNLVKLLLLENPKQIIVIDNLLSSEKVNLPDDEKINFIEASITDDDVLSNLQDNIDYVFHLATFHGNQNSIYDPLSDHQNNTLTTLKLFETLKNFKNIKKIVYSSAGCSVAKKTFDDALATTENDPIELNQDSPYSISKIVGEFYSVYYFKQHKLPVVRARFQNVYGPGEILGAGKWRGTYATIWRNVTPVFIRKSLNGEKLPLENHGIASRDFIFVEDICKGLIACALKGIPGDVYNIASGKEITVRQLADTIKILTGNSADHLILPKRSWDNSGKRFGSTKKAETELNFRAEIELEEGLQKTIDWTKKNLFLIDQCILKHQKHLS